MDLSFTEQAGHAAQADAASVILHPPHDPRRREVEAFVRHIYASRYGAHVQDFAPVLVSLRDPDGHIAAAAGYRPAAQMPLFLERYLDAPVESLLASHGHAQPPRECIVEIGHLAASRAGEGRRLFFQLGPHLAAQRFRWVVGTATEELRHLLLRIGIAPLVLGQADPAALGEEAGHWGSYYDHRPLVLAGQLRQALRHLARSAAARARG
ncbi:thermostable hemolysin [Variovorax defluvii]|uniref:Thermostable hemolysin n=1 Tax=Variovorax defluvii TaxID=913761 RepID=A0ABP8GZK2_9BURK